ncbi:MAG: GNAT family N-acetyltransferase [Defluviitaleaceae bacterium]|nr:GNAT family N-acetyltransferase [Defluviitaleaceae bacterium]
MEIRQGTSEEMMSLWYKKFTSEFFASNIKNNNAEFWTIEIDERLIGELYIFKSLSSRNLIDRETVAYLCAFRIISEMQSKGYGTKLIRRVFDHLVELGFKYAVIGVEPNNLTSIRLYEHLGFVTKLGIVNTDPCDVDCNFNSIACDDFLLLKKTL